jgi:Ca2+-transporting ATPase
MIQPTHHERSDATPWWTLSVEDALARLGSGHHGLDEGEARQRLAQVGANTIQEARGVSPIVRFLNQFKSPLIYILLVSAALTTVLREYSDTAIIMAVLFLNATIGFFQEYKAERALLALREMTAPRAAVLRAGQDREIDSKDLVPGDILLLESGTKVPADGRLVQCSGLQVDESLLTGESTVVDKATDAIPDPALPLADRTNMVFMGSIVTRGRAHAVATATGMATALGRIAGEIRTAEDPPTPLQLRMTRFAKTIGAAIVVACAVAFPLGVSLGQSPSDMIRTVIALIVSAIPEGLPVALTLALAIGVSRMARRKAIVRSLPAVETLGSCNVIATDKTGTLTENRMTLQVIWAGGATYRVSGSGYEPSGSIQQDGRVLSLGPDSAAHRLLVGASLNNEASLYLADGTSVTRGDPTEIALLVAAAKAGIFKGDLEEDAPRVGWIPFEPERGFSATSHAKDGSQTLFVKGAPERILPMCVAAIGPGDKPGPLDGALVAEQAELLGREGFRVLAFAEGPSRTAVDTDTRLDSLTFVGLVGIMDPPRPEVPAAIAACKSAGIRVLMLTGDHRSTASAIAARVGIEPADDVVEGRAVERMDEAELAEACSKVSVFARVEPHHKLRIVQTLRRQGETVAVTGDGVNDAPALRAADIGVAMGMRGTDVAKEASSIVVTDDNFATIVAAVEEGRVVFDNVRKVTFFLLSTGIAAVIAIFAAILGGFPLPILPAQIIWVNLVTNGIQVSALAFEPGEKGTLRKPPRRKGEGILSGLLWERVAIVGVLIAIATLAFFLFEHYALDRTVEHARTMALTTMVMFQAIHVSNARSEHLSVFRKSPFSNPFLFVGTIAALLIHAGSLYLDPTQRLLEVQPLSLTEWLRIAVAAVSIILVMELHKLLRSPADAAGTRRTQPSGVP